MKNLTKLLGIIALAAVIGFGMAGCEQPTDSTTGKTLTGITAAYTPTTTIYTDTTLDTLKEGLTVTARYSDSTTAPVTTYSLSVVDDTLIVGENTVTVTYTEGGVTKIDTFTVSVSATHVHNWSKISETAATCTTAGTEKWECTASTPSHHEDRPGAAIDPDAHDYQNYVQTTAPTCTTAGKEEAPCTRDSNHVKGIRDISIDPDAHNWNTETGLCNNNCGELYYNLGDTGPGGGKIFYVSAEGFTMTDNNSTAHYLEAAPVDMSYLRWTVESYGNYPDIASMAYEIGTGRLNTTLILTIANDAPAAKACNEYTNNEKTDWFLPSINELEQLYINRDSVGIFSTYIYWSSSVYHINTAMDYDFGAGSSGGSGKEWTRIVHPIRAF